MVSFSVLSLAFAGSLAAANALPQKSGLTTSLKTIRNPNAAGLSKHARSLAKYGGAVPEGLLPRGWDSGSVGGTYDAANGEWISPVSIGTPPQELGLILDSGSWDLIVYSTQSDPSLLPANITLYDPDKSYTAEYLDGYSFDIIYGNGDTETEGDIECSGDVFKDIVTIGGVTAYSQAVESIVNYTAGFATLGATGIVGMALSKNNTVKPVKQKTFFDSIKNELEKPLFVADLYLKADSHLDFGYLNKSLIEGPVTWADVDTDDSQQGWWSITIDAYQVGSEKAVEGAFQTIVDTGTTNLLFQPDIVGAYYDQVPGSVNSTEFAAFLIPCDAKLPDFTVTISGRPFTIPGSLLNLEAINSTTCVGNIQVIPASTIGGIVQPNACLGATFMLPYLTAFDLGTLQVGFAQKRYIENATFV
ncbi:aspergillopepsin [Talaromyces pinophilus]|uniref:Aspergillopepsin n=1 Tax=Talaromyces pinophilus TaxID=128442 RepID=A0A0B8N1M1_TALPI|nr:aspergillopepsin [Talaromyces pinophilus]